MEFCCSLFHLSDMSLSRPHVLFNILPGTLTIPLRLSPGTAVSDGLDPTAPGALSGTRGTQWQQRDVRGIVSPYSHDARRKFSLYS